MAERGFEIEARRHQPGVTIGATECAPDVEAKRWVAAADAALYEAKRGGRGRVVWASAANMAAEFQAVSGKASGLAA